MVKDVMKLGSGSTRNLEKPEGSYSMGWIGASVFSVHSRWEQALAFICMDA
jgi:hypothetical protein